MLKTHEGRTAVITGAANGLGKAIAVGLAQRGARVAGLDLNDMSDTGRLVAEAGVDWIEVRGDVSRPGDVNAALASVTDAFGAADILVNNAGVYPQFHWDDLDFETWHEIFRINVDSQFLMAKAFLPGMRANGYGRVVNLATSSMHIPVPHATHYVASKMAVIGLTRGLAADVAADGVTVNALSPGLTDTGTGVLSEPLLDRIPEMQAFKRRAVPEDVVGAAAFLTSEDSAWITSQTIWASGGMAR